MPRKKSYKKKRSFGRKKSYKKTMRRFKRKSNSRFKKSLNLGKGFPDRMMVNHKYHVGQAQTLLTPGINNFLFATNKMTTIEAGSFTWAGAHRPYYFDQMAAIYNHYVVMGAKITFKIYSTTAGDGTNCTCQYAAFINDDATTSVGFNTLMEQSNAKNRVYDGVQSSPAGAPTTFGLKWSGKRIFGKKFWTDKQFWGTTAVAPTELQYFQLSAFQTQAVQSTMQIEVDVEYCAVWFERKEVVASGP